MHREQIKLFFCTFKVVALILIFLLQQEIQLFSQDKGGVQVNKFLEMSFEELMNVELTTAGKRPENINEIPASVVIITRNDIKRYGYTTLSEILENVPGMYGINDYNYHFFGVRGFWSGEGRNIIYLVNGIDQSRGHMLHYNIRSFPIPVEAIGRIEIIRGPMSVIYGSGAFFGAINIITDEIYTQDQQGQATIAVGSFNTKKAALSLVSEENDMSFSFNAAIHKSDGINVPYSKMISDLSVLPGMGIYDYNNTTKKRLEKNNKYFDCSIKYKEFYCNVSHTLYEDEVYFSYPPVDKGSTERTHDTHILAGAKLNVTDKLNINLQVNSYQSHIEFIWDQIHPDYFGNQIFRMQRNGAEIIAFYEPFSNLSITGGYVNKTHSDLHSFLILSSDNFIIDYGMKPGEYSTTNAIYAQADYSPLSKLHLVGGIRAEKMEKYDIEMMLNPGMENESTINGKFNHDNIEYIPRLAAIYSYNENNTFKFLYGKAINQPSFFTMAVQMFAGVFETPKPEIIETFEVNYLANPIEHLSLNASLFYNIFHHLLVRELQPGEIGGIYTNAGKMVTTGAELTVKAEPSVNIGIELSVILQKSEDKRLGFESIGVGYSPEILGYFKFFYSPFQDITASITGNYVGSMRTHWEVEKENPDGTMGDRIGEDVDGYLIAGFNLRYSNFIFNKVFINVRIHNLFDTEYYYPAYTNNAYFNKGTLGRGRSITITTGYRF
ncbi:TonB-dependent receptor [bacterium]|nr:TonB-dependent receptor [bacterium]